MFAKNRNKRIELCVMVVAGCFILAGLCTILATSSTALAKKPGGDGGDSGNTPLCITLPATEAYGGVWSDGESPYCDNKKKKIEAIMTQDGHVNLEPNTGKREGRTFYVSVDGIETEGWRLIVGGWNESFDMRAMAIGEVRDDVNLRINTYAPDGNIWRLMFESDFVGWGTTGEGSTYITVTRTDTDAWKVELDEGDIAVLIIQTPENDFLNGGLVIVPPFTATITYK